MKIKWSTKRFKSRLLLWTVVGLTAVVSGSLDPVFVTIVKPALEDILMSGDE